jgi:YggT family protein
MFITFLVYFVNALFTVLTWAIIGRALLSWFPLRPGNPFYPLALILHQITEPILAPMRRIIPTIGMIDISPLIALFLLQIIQGVLQQALINAARSSGGF